ncbi:MAG: hypothetical protein DMG72_24450 [Acidobacteria bacterium]|nr:MAG: hypothetical protein DMG72_24450 [Acidobacteriota bacterium]
MRQAATSDLQEAALDYVRRSWPVFPLHSIAANGRCTCNGPDCSSPGKLARTKDGCKDATIDPETIRRWWTQCPDANIGVATGTPSGLVVLDIDGEGGIGWH